MFFFAGGTIFSNRSNKDYPDYLNDKDKSQGKNDGSIGGSRPLLHRIRRVFGTFSSSEKDYFSDIKQNSYKT